MLRKLIRPIFICIVCSLAPLSLAEESYETEIRAVLDGYHEALATGDLEGILAVFSERYSNSMGATKQMLTPFFSDPGVLAAARDQRVIMEAATFQRDGDVVTVTPVSYEYPQAPRANWAYRFSREEDGIWRLVNSEQIY